MTSTLTSSGSWETTRGSAAFNPLITSTVFAPDWRRMSSVTVGSVETRKRSLFLRSVFNAANIAKLNGSTVNVGNDQLVKLAWIGKSSERTKRQFLFAGGYISAGHVSILAFESLPDLRDRDLVSG